MRFNFNINKISKFRFLLFWNPICLLLCFHPRSLYTNSVFVFLFSILNQLLISSGLKNFFIYSNMVKLYLYENKMSN